VGGWWKRLTHDQRVLVLTIFAGLPGVVVSLALLWLGDFSARVQWTASIALVGVWTGITVTLREQIVRPLGSLANMLAALREGDRAEVADRVLGGNALELFGLEQKAGDAATAG